MKQPIKLRFKKWRDYLKPGWWRWLRLANKEVNKPENLKAIQSEAHKRCLNVMIYGTSQPELERKPNAADKLWQEAINIMEES